MGLHAAPHPRLGSRFPRANRHGRRAGARPTARNRRSRRQRHRHAHRPSGSRTRPAPRLHRQRRHDRRARGRRPQLRPRRKKRRPAHPRPRRRNIQLPHGTKPASAHRPRRLGTLLRRRPARLLAERRRTNRQRCPARTPHRQLPRRGQLPAGHPRQHRPGATRRLRFRSRPGACNPYPARLHR